MKNTFACPHCHAVLNPNVKILLGIKHQKERGLILLSPQPGNFRFICDQSIKNSIKQGDSPVFFCPVCSAELISPRDNSFVELSLVDPNGKTRQVEFSRVFGTHATFIIDGDQVSPYGEDAAEEGPVNFFGT